MSNLSQYEACTPPRAQLVIVTDPASASAAKQHRISSDRSNHLLHPLTICPPPKPRGLGITCIAIPHGASASTHACASRRCSSTAKSKPGGPKRLNHESYGNALLKPRTDKWSSTLHSKPVGRWKAWADCVHPCGGVGQCTLHVTLTLFLWMADRER